MAMKDHQEGNENTSSKVLLESLSVFQIIDYLKMTGSCLKIEDVVSGKSFELLLNSRGDLCYRLVGDKMIKLFSSALFKRFLIDIKLVEDVKNGVLEGKTGPQGSKNGDVRRLITSINTIIDGMAGDLGRKENVGIKEGAEEKTVEDKVDVTKIELAKIMLNDLYDEVLSSEGQISLRKYVGNTYDVTVVLKSDVRAKIFTKKLSKWNFKNVIIKGNIVTFRQYFPQDQVDDALFVGMDIK